MFRSVFVGASGTTLCVSESTSLLNPPTNCLPGIALGRLPNLALPPLPRPLVAGGWLGAMEGVSRGAEELGPPR